MTSILQRSIRRVIRGLAAGLAIFHAQAADTFYVHPQGNDAANGRSPATAWGTVAKVNSASPGFAPGTTILFAAGGEWRERLQPSCSGTPGAPIVFDCYQPIPPIKGDASARRAVFWGSDLLGQSSFVKVAGTESTWSLPVSSQAHSVFVNHTFLRSAHIVSGRSGNTATQRVLVDANPGFWAWFSGKLYVNTGGIDPRTDPRLWTATFRDDMVYCNQVAHLVFRNLVVDETARDDAGYGFRVWKSEGILLEDCAAYRCGKHHFGVINSNGFVGRRLYAGGDALPDLGSGGATYLVSYSDGTRSGDTSQWIDCTVESEIEEYPGFYTHGPGMGDILVRNPTFRGAAVATGYGESNTVRIQGGLIESTSSGVSAGLYLNGRNSVADGVTLKGKVRVEIGGGGNHLVQNLCIIEGRFGSGGIVKISAANSVFRFNTVLCAAEGSDSPVWLLGNADQSEIYGNIIRCGNHNQAIWMTTNGEPALHHNLYVQQPTPTFVSGYGSAVSFSSWRAVGRDQGSAVGDPRFTNLPGGDYSLRPSSAACERVPATPGMNPPSTDIAGRPRHSGQLLDAGAWETQFPLFERDATSGLVTGAWVLTPETVYELQRTTSLAGWMSMGNATAGIGGIRFFSDLPDPGLKSVFYRLVEKPN